MLPIHLSPYPLPNNLLYIYSILISRCYAERCETSVSVAVPFQAVLSRFAARCQKRLDCITRSGPKRGLKQPTLDEITQSLVSRVFFARYSLMALLFHPGDHHVVEQVAHTGAPSD